MTDTIIKGTGNSRTLGSVPNFKTLYPDYDDFAAAMANKTLPIDLGPLNPTGVDVMGTPLDKAHLFAKELGSYIGTGALSLTLNFAAMPQFVFVHGGTIWPSGYGHPSVVFIDVVNMIYTSFWGEPHTADITIRNVSSVSNNQIVITNQEVKPIANIKDEKYYYIALN